MPVQTFVRREPSALVYQTWCGCGGWNRIVDGIPQHMDWCTRVVEEAEFTKQKKYLRAAIKENER